MPVAFLPQEQIDATMAKLPEKLRIAFQARLDEVGRRVEGGYEFPNTQYMVAAYDCFRPMKTDITLGKVVSFARTVATHKRVSDEIQQEREAICLKCDKVRFVNGEPRCSICGCCVSGMKIKNLAAYEESRDRPGCKHPERKSGKGWPMA